MFYKEIFLDFSRDSQAVVKNYIVLVDLPFLTITFRRYKQIRDW